MANNQNAKGYQFTAPDLTIRTVPLRIGFKLQYEFIPDDPEAIQVINQLDKHEYVALDTETTGLNFIKHDTVSFSFCFDKISYVVILKHNKIISNISEVVLKELVTKIFKKKLLLFNARFDLRFMFRAFPYLKELPWTCYDVQSLIFLADSNIRMPALKRSTELFLGLQQPEFDKAWLGDNIKNSDPKELVYYSAFDAYATLELFKVFYPELNKKYGFIVSLDSYIIKPVMDFEDTEIDMDVKWLEALKRKCDDRRNHLQVIIWKEWGIFNIGSHDQLRQKFITAGLNTGVYTKPSDSHSNGQMSTGIKALENLKGQNVVVIDWLIEFSKLGKLLNSYVVPLLERLYKAEKMKFHYRLSIAPSGRIQSGKYEKSSKKKRNTSCFTDVSIQGIPKPKTIKQRLDYDPVTHKIEMKEDGKHLVETFTSEYNVRKAFTVPSDDWVWVSTDYSSQEIVVGTNLSKDPVWLKALKNKEDIHKASAIAIWGAENYSKDKRKLAKVFTFSLMYLGTVYTLMTKLKIPEFEAIQLFNKYTNAIRGYYLEWVPAVCRIARQQGFVVNCFGFPRKLRWYYRQTQRKQAYADRTAVNHLIQGTAGIMIKIDLIKLHRLIEDKYKGLVLFRSDIHDEVNFVVHKSVLIDWIIDQNNIMESVTPKSWEIPLTVTNSIGTNWGEIFEVVLDKEKRILIPTEVKDDEASVKVDSAVFDDAVEDDEDNLEEDLF